jgi:hypothetical protein
MNYDAYNREERAACAHLFRLLHERLAAEPDASPLRQVLRLLRPRLKFSAGTPELRADGAAIFAEVALIRDAYQHRKSEPGAFMDALVRLVAKQEGVSEVRAWSALPWPLNDPSRTHPTQIAQKGREENLLTEAERRVFGAVQGMFNAKPDLVFVLSSCVIVFEAKLTERFDEEQLARTRKIAEVWSSLLFEDLGFAEPPPFAIARLGDAGTGVDLSWQELSSIASDCYAVNDRTRIALGRAASLSQ